MAQIKRSKGSAPFSPKARPSPLPLFNDLETLAHKKTLDCQPIYDTLNRPENRKMFLLKNE